MLSLIQLLFGFVGVQVQVGLGWRRGRAVVPFYDLRPLIQVLGKARLGRRRGIMNVISSLNLILGVVSDRIE